jgi:hypothetical protein
MHGAVLPCDASIMARNSASNISMVCASCVALAARRLRDSGRKKRGTLGQYFSKDSISANTASACRANTEPNNR